MVSFFFLVVDAGRFSMFMLKALTELSVLFKRGRVSSIESGRGEFWVEMTKICKIDV